DGIRDFHVTGVQTCALPISPRRRPPGSATRWPGSRHRAWLWLLLCAAGRRYGQVLGECIVWITRSAAADRLRSDERLGRRTRREIGRAACRERGAIAGGGGT